MGPRRRRRGDAAGGRRVPDGGNAARYAYKKLHEESNEIKRRFQRKKMLKKKFQAAGRSAIFGLALKSEMVKSGKRAEQARALAEVDGEQPRPASRPGTTNSRPGTTASEKADASPPPRGFVVFCRSALRASKREARLADTVLARASIAAAGTAT